MFDWIQHLANWLVYSVLGIDSHSKLGDALNFFVYDTIKIFILLITITLIMGTINSYFPIDKVRDYLTTRKWYGLDYLVASFFGTITPFCSCSSVPLFIGFVKGGIPLGVTLTFLISSPLVDAVTIAIFFGMFGWKTTIIYVISGIILSMIAGYILGRMRLEPLLTDWVKNLLAQQQRLDKYQEGSMRFTERLLPIINEAFGVVKGVSLYILLGVAIGGLMHGYIPTSFFEAYISKENPWAVPLAVIIGVPMYSNTAGILPIMQVLVEKGIPIGTVIAFSMSVVALSIPESLLLRKVMTIKMLMIFLTVVTICIIISGYLFNLIL